MHIWLYMTLFPGHEFEQDFALWCWYKKQWNFSDSPGKLSSNKFNWILFEFLKKQDSQKSSTKPWLSNKNTGVRSINQNVKISSAHYTSLCYSCYSNKRCIYIILAVNQLVLLLSNATDLLLNEMHFVIFVYLFLL